MKTRLMLIVAEEMRAFDLRLTSSLFKKISGWSLTGFIIAAFIGYSLAASRGVVKV